MNGVALLFERAAQGSVTDATTDFDGTLRGVQHDFLGQGVQQDVCAVGVGDRVEGVPGTECFDPRRVGYEFLQLLHRRGTVDVRRRVLKVSCPVLHRIIFPL
ncbi:hypothetical protein D3C73_1253400 [compost metagenome]